MVSSPIHPRLLKAHTSCFNPLHLLGLAQAVGKHLLREQYLASVVLFLERLRLILGILSEHSAGVPRKLRVAGVETEF